MSCDPCGRCEIGELLDGPVGETGQDVSQIVAHLDLHASVAFDDGEDRGHTRCGLLTADMNPVFSTMEIFP